MGCVKGNNSDRRQWPGFSPDVVGRVGEPYVTTKTDSALQIGRRSGLGLGLFIAMTLSNALARPFKAENRARRELERSSRFLERAHRGGAKGLPVEVPVARSSPCIGSPQRS